MVKLTIDGNAITAEDGTSILDAAMAADINIPTLCYLKDICEVGACRICAIEVEGNDNLTAACNIVVEDGMTITTNSSRVINARRVNVELALSAHNADCTSCERNLNCNLQSLSKDLNIADAPYDKKLNFNNWSNDFPLIRDNLKCITCMRCINICEKVQSLGVWDTRGQASYLNVNVADGKKIENSNCSICGQCVLGCPVGALCARDDTAKVFEALQDPDTIVSVQIAPAIRTAWGEDIGLNRDNATVGRMVAAARALGADYVFDTCFSADLTIMEEGAELLEMLSKKEMLFTSCCPGWVRFAKSEYPEFVSNISTVKSPMQIFGAALKSWFAKRNSVDPAKIFNVAIMPCIAKKDECTIPSMKNDVDAVITTREFIKMLKISNINVNTLKDENFDDIMGTSTGAGFIFGTSGGVAEALLRHTHYLVTGKNPTDDAYYSLNATSDVTEITADLGGTFVKAAVVSGLANARKLMEKIKSGKANYDFVEVMACPGGCLGGGGQPISCNLNGLNDVNEERLPILRNLDKDASIRFSHDNPSIKKAYEEFFEKPLSQKAYELLHVKH